MSIWLRSSVLTVQVHTGQLTEILICVFVKVHKHGTIPCQLKIRIFRGTLVSKFSSKLRGEKFCQNHQSITSLCSPSMFCFPFNMIRKTDRKNTQICETASSKIRLSVVRQGDPRDSINMFLAAAALCLWDSIFEARNPHLGILSPHFLTQFLNTRRYTVVLVKETNKWKEVINLTKEIWVAPWWKTTYRNRSIYAHFLVSKRMRDTKDHGIIVPLSRFQGLSTILRRHPGHVRRHPRQKKKIILHHPFHL
jgi:hypothetical protein